MKAKSVIGKRIVKIDQIRFFNDNTGRMDIDVVRFHFDDGSTMWPVTVETGGAEYAHDFGVSKPKKDRNG